MDSDHSNFDFGKMKNMLEIAKQFSNSTNTPAPQVSPLEIDNIVSSPEMNVIKAALPYMNLDTQKTLAIFIKFLELSKTMKLYSNYAASEVPELNKTNMSKRDMLYAIRSRCSDKNRQILDTVLNMYNMKSMVTGMNNPSSQPETYNQDNPLENTPSENLNQSELIEKLKHLMKG